MSTGYNTYIIAALLGLASAAKALDWITPEAYSALEGVLLAGGLTALRAGIAAQK